MKRDYHSSIGAEEELPKNLYQISVENPVRMKIVNSIENLIE